MNTRVIESIPRCKFPIIDGRQPGWVEKMKRLVEDQKAFTYKNNTVGDLPKEIKKQLTVAGYTDEILRSSPTTHFLIPPTLSSVDMG